MNLKLFRDKFEHETVKVMRDLKIPGMSVIVTKDGEAIYQRSFGVRERGDVKPASVETLYGVSSITKSVTCMAILQLHEAGKLDINDLISKYIPVDLGFKDNPIKILHLMSHSSGIPSLMTFYFSQINQQLFKGKAPEFPLGNWGDFFFHVNDAKTEVLSPPNTKYYYWNGGFALLGQIIEKVSGKSFEEYVKENILQPLEMNRSTFSLEDVKKDKDSSRGFNYNVKDKQIERETTDLLSGPFIAGAGGLISSVQEITNYLHCHMNGGTFNGKKVLDESLSKEMLNPHNRNIQSKYPHFCPGAKPAYGYGWRIFENFFGYKLIYHGGMSGVSGGYVGFIPELNLTYAQLQNVNWSPLYLMLTAFALLLGKDPEEEIPYYKRKRHYRSLCGRYEAYKKTITFKIEQKGSVLFVIDDNWPDKSVTPLIPKNDDPEVMDFYIITDYGTLDIPFTKHEDGQITFDWERHVLHKKTIELEED